MSPVRVHFLGAGDAFCASGRLQAGYLVRSESTTLLLDCGATTLAAFKRDRQPIEAVDAVLISHMHGDHFAGLPFLFLEYVYEKPRRRPLCIAGPPGIAERIHDLYRAMYRGPAEQPLPYPVEFVELRPGVAARIGDAEVEPFRVPHTENDLSLGFRVGIENRRLVYSGDTGWTEELVRQSEGSDLFVCECSFYETRIDTHLDYPRLAENHRRFETRRLILTHLGREVLARSDALELELARDGLTLEL